MKRSELVIITGGLGPTKDDITKKTLKDFFGMSWRIDQEVIDQLEMYFKDRGRQLMEINKIQAELPDGCITLFNEWGTAPGMWFEIDGRVVISLPGVPYEMKNIFEFKALPKIQERFQEPSLYHKTIVTFNIPESILAKQIEDIEEQLPSNIKLAYLPGLNVVRLRLTGTMSDGLDIYKSVDYFVQRIVDRVGSGVIATQD
jgi:nicotinamide-nucleotide amidase